MWDLEYDSRPDGRCGFDSSEMLENGPSDNILAGAGHLPTVILICHAGLAQTCVPLLRLLYWEGLVQLFQRGICEDVLKDHVAPVQATGFPNLRMLWAVQYLRFSTNHTELQRTHRGNVLVNLVPFEGLNGSVTKQWSL